MTDRRVTLAISSALIFQSPRARALPKQRTDLEKRIGDEPYANFNSLIASEFTTCPPIRFVA